MTPSGEGTGARILLFTGKGGVGKTTTAAATALRLADRGVKTLLLSTDTAHSLSDALATPLTDEPAEVTPGLWAVQVDTQGRFEAAWRDVQGFLVDLLARGGVDPITADELTVLPGVDEVLALLAVRELALTGDWDTLVVDCAPTAETLRLLALPEALGWYLDRVFPAQRRIARSVRPLAAVLGRGDAVPPDDIFEALLRLADELAGVRQLLGDPAVTSVRLVLTPETVVVAEARRTFTALALYGYAVDLVVANRVFPAGDDEWRRGWAEAQARQLVTIRESFAGLPVRELAYRPAEPVGAVALRELADALYGELPGLDPAPPADTSRIMRVNATDEGFELHLTLPLAQRADVDAARAGDELIVSVGAYRRVLDLPGVLRRCDVVGGHYDGRELHVRFRPDPRQWSSHRPLPYKRTVPRRRGGERARGGRRPGRGGADPGAGRG
ncbi:ArsA family ATPase [Jatrophihabitans endophyticus]|uniref:ArsA family ATPase n=1 Tax=Jatrophihabitans endophyticus TaxID=1206085 RepID=UPI0009FE4B53|nr:ArsA family ATPase [Jatrophihabitans endophyticus]